jgi:hypothetical protein
MVESGAGHYRVNFWIAMIMDSDNINEYWSKSNQSSSKRFRRAQNYLISQGRYNSPVGRPFYAAKTWSALLGGRIRL